MVLVNKLKGKIAENGYTVKSLSEEIGIDRTTFNRRLQSNGETFTISEASKIAVKLRLTAKEAIEIFFSDIVA